MPTIGRAAVTIRALVVTVGLALLSSCIPAAGPPPVPELRGRVGAFAVEGASEYDALSEAGLNVVISEFPKDAATREVIKERDVAVLDTSVQRLIYSRMCAGGQPCLDPTDPEWAATLREIRRHVDSVKGTAGLAGFYLVDDYRAGLGYLLADARAAIRELAPEYRSVCGFSLNLTQGARTPKFDSLERALTNYSPQWCDDVLIYSYVPGSPNPRTGVVDWSMSQTLRGGLDRLRKAGWDPKTSRLIGTPQTIAYEPRTGIGPRVINPEYRIAPTAVDLAAQVRAFCAAGAVAIVGYAWNDDSSGNVQELYNSPAMRRTLASTARGCLPGNETDAP